MSLSADLANLAVGSSRTERKEGTKLEEWLRKFKGLEDDWIGKRQKGRVPGQQAGCKVPI